MRAVVTTYGDKMSPWIGGILLMALAYYRGRYLKETGFAGLRKTLGVFAYVQWCAIIAVFIYGFVILYGAVRELM